VQNLPAPLSVQSPTGLALLNLEINRQAAMISYLSDFHMMMWLTLLAMPMLLLVRKPTAAVPTPKQSGTVASWSQSRVHLYSQQLSAFPFLD
jgi:hypothetical protein